MCIPSFSECIRPLLHVSVKLTEGYPSENRSTKKSLGLLHVRLCYPLTDRCPFRFAQSNVLPIDYGDNQTYQIYLFH